MALNRDQILKAEDLPTEEVPTPEWGGSVLVRGLSGTERDTFEAAITAEKARLDGQPGSEYVLERTNMRAKLVVRAVVDEDGKRVFEDSDVPALGAKSALVLSRLFDKISELSGMGNDEEASAEGNSDAAPSGGSTSSEQTQPESQ